MAAVDLAIGDGGAVGVGLAADAAALDAAAGQGDRPGPRPVIAAIIAIDLRRPAELRHDDDERTGQQAALVQVVEQRGERCDRTRRVARCGNRSFRDGCRSWSASP